MFCPLLILFSLMSVAFYHYIRSTPRSIYAVTRERIESVLDPPNVDERTKLRARALPNKRLIAAFDIHNTFVSDDPQLHRTFVKEVNHLLKRWSGNWDLFAETSKFIVAKYIQIVRKDPESRIVLPFASFVQAVTLATVVATLFETDVAVLDYDDVAFVANKITERWLDSKTMNLSREGLDDIHILLNKWIPSRSNALDFIIPAFETMWRVVAITVAHNYGTTHVLEVCEAFLRTPNHGQFRQQQGAPCSVESMILESLRLYPPTRHISRAMKIQPPLCRQFLELSGVLYTSKNVADVETFQRTVAWGPNPDVYDPTRHSLAEVQNNQDAVLFAFGHGSMACVARKLAPHAAGILFAAIMNGFSPSGRCVIDPDGGTIGGREGWDRWKVRMSTM